MSNNQPEQNTKQKLQQILVAYIALAKSELSDDEFNKIDIKQLQRFLAILAEALPLEYLIDPVLIRHGLEILVAGRAPEEAVMHVFVLYIYRKISEGSNHPLEVGIIRQQILGILPMFETALNNGAIATQSYDKNADALVHIADSTGDVPEIIEALSYEYLRLKKSC
ncbi:MAG: hypothetical protein HRU20_07480 [Pseudomonadales bacterium]|nr:hypothetical protein [Pseudomonadales bacterium]